MPDSGTRTVRSFCRACQSVCGILVDVHIDGDSDRVLQVHGDRDHPVSLIVFLAGIALMGIQGSLHFQHKDKV